MMYKKFLAATAISAVIVATVPTHIDVQAQSVKPYEKVVFEKNGKDSYQIVVKNKTAPFVFKFSTGVNAFFTNVDEMKDLSYPFGSYLGSELYIQIVSQDQNTVYDSFLFDTTTGKYITDYDISNYDYNKLYDGGAYSKIPFSLGEVKLIDEKTNEITFKQIYKDVVLYDFELHRTVTLHATKEEVTYQIPSQVYLMIDPVTLEEVGEFHLNKKDGYTLNPPHGTTYYFVEYKKRARTPDATFPGIKPEQPKIVKPIEVKKSADKSYFEKTAAQIANEKYINIDKTVLKDIKGSSHRDAIVLLNKMGIINGYADKTFKPSKTLRYSDIIKLTGRFANVPTLKAKDITATMQKQYNTKDAEVISYMEQLQHVYGENIAYSKDVTRGEFAIILANFIEHIASEKTGEDVDVTQLIADKGFTSNYTVKNEKYTDAVTILHYFGITNIENGQFNDDKTLNRAQLASFLTRIYAINFDHIQ